MWVSEEEEKKKCGVRSARGEEGEGSVNHQQKLHREKKRLRRGIKAKAYYTLFKGLPKTGKYLDPNRFFTFSSLLWTAFRRLRAFFYRQAPAPFFSLPLFASSGEAGQKSLPSRYAPALPACVHPPNLPDDKIKSH